MQNIFDSHAHYDDPRFDEGRDTLLSSMASHGVRAIMNVGNTTHANLAGIELAKKYPFVYCSIGIHPDQSAEIAAQNSREYLDVIAQQLSYEKAMALGEIGLDYYYDDDAPRDIQKRSLKSSLPWQKIWMFLSSFTTVTPIRTPWICSKSIVQKALCTVFPARQRLQKRFSALVCTSDLPALSPLKMPVALSKLLQKSHWTGCWSRQTAHTWHRNHSAANAAIPPCSPA